MYDHNEDELKRQSGFGAVGLGFMNGDLSDEEEDGHKPVPAQGNKHAVLIAATQYQPQAPAPIPLAAPRPGYPAPVSAIDLPRTPSANQQMSEIPPHLRNPPGDLNAPRVPPPAYNGQNTRTVPNAPHPLQPPMTPITPVFARPSPSPAPRDVKFSSDAIMRGNSEDALLPRRGDKGDDFWRRFSVIAKEDTKQPSSWLDKTQNGINRLSRWVWVVGMILLIIVAVAIGLWYYISHNSTSATVPKALGGSENETGGGESSSLPPGATSSPHVTPTNTVKDRRALPTPISDILGLMNLKSPEDIIHSNPLTGATPAAVNGSQNQSKLKKRHFARNRNHGLH